MKLGFSVNAFSKYSLLNSIEKISKTGYDGVEIVLDKPHAFLPLTKNKITQIKQSLIKNNIQVTNLNSNTVSGWTKDFAGEKFEPSLSNINQKFRKWRLEYTKQSIDIAEYLNSKSISITSGLNDLNNSDLCLNLFHNSLIEIAEYAEKKNISIAIEYEPGLLIDNSDKVWHLISKDFKNIGLNLDTCHAEVNQENLSDIIQKFRKKIIHTHISDCKNHIHYHLLPGEGKINFKFFYDSLNNVGYSGFLTAELYTYYHYPEDAASKAFIYLKNLIK
jgi:fructoselysine 3-epimerase